jgi:hypothetical protein
MLPKNHGFEGDEVTFKVKSMQALIRNTMIEKRFKKFLYFISVIPLKKTHSWLAVSLNPFDKKLPGGAKYVRDTKKCWEKAMDA